MAQAANAQAMLSDSEALIASLELAIEKLKRELRGLRSERTALIDQMELQLEELVMAATEDEVAAQAAAAKTSSVRSFTRKRPVRKPWPEDIERERVVIDPPVTCACCGGSRLSKLGEDVTETLKEIPRRFKVIETVREKFTCRDCEAISQPPAPFHATPRGFIGPHLLATIPLRQVWNAYAAHPPEHPVQMRGPRAFDLDAGRPGRVWNGRAPATRGTQNPAALLGWLPSLALVPATTTCTEAESAVSDAETPSGEVDVEGLFVPER